MVVASRTEEHCRSLVEAITSAGGTASYEVADLTEDGAAERIVAATVERHGRLDGVFSVAGGSGRIRGRPGARSDARRVGRHARPQRQNPVPRVRRGGRQMLGQDPDAEGQRGAILHMGSVTSTSPVADLLRDPRLRRGKGRHRRADPDDGLLLRPEGNPCERGVAGRHPHADGRTGRERPRDRRVHPLEATARRAALLDRGDIAGAAAFLLSRDALAITGQVLDVDAGWSLTDAPWPGPETAS